ncbi:MAG: ATP-binding protein, partial [Bacteroidota bacterium]
GKEKQAYQFFGRALDLAIITDNIPDKAASFTQLGKIYLQRRDTVKAKQVFTHAISLYQQQKMKKEELDSRNYLAQCYIMSKQWEAAITELETCLILEEELQEPESLLDTYLAFAQVYEYLDDFAQALTYQRLHQEIKDTMLAQSQSQSVAAIEKIHELEDQKKEMVLVQKNESIQNLKRLGWLSTCSLILLVLFIILLVKRTRAQAFTNQLLVEKSREIEVTNQELSQSNRELKEFTHAVSHDLKQPLRTIGSFASLMVQRYHRQLDEEGDHYLNFITQGVQHMHLLLSDLQTYAYIGRANVEPAPVNLNHILEEVKANLHQQIEERGAVIKANPLPSLMGHQTSLYQLFQNLISNAIKFQIQGVTPKISIRVMDEENYLRVEVVDNGIGIPDAFKARIFRAFQRLHNQSDYPGTGIGLAICHKVMLQLGGKIDVQSELGKGSKFRLWFPKEVLVAHPKEQRPIKKEKNNLGILPIFPQKANLEAER